MPVEFATLHAGYRSSWLKLNRAKADGLWKLFDTYLQDVGGDIVKYYSPGREWLSSVQRTAMQEALTLEAGRFADAYSEFISDGMRKAAGVPMNTQAAARTYYANLCHTANAGATTEQLEALNILAFSQIPTATVEALWNRIAGGLILSDKIWDLAEQGTHDIQQILVASAIGGKDTMWTARAVERHIRPGSEGPGWTSKGVPAKRPLPTGTYVGMKGRPAMYARAGIMVRTEMRLAAHDALVRGQVATRALMEPAGLNYLQGVEWKISASHPELDVCDSYASGGSKDLPPGVYHPQDVPTSHACCLCYLQDYLMPPKQFADLLNSKADPSASPKVLAAEAVQKAVTTTQTPGLREMK